MNIENVQLLKLKRFLEKTRKFLSFKSRKSARKKPDILRIIPDIFPKKGKFLSFKSNESKKCLLLRHLVLSRKLSEFFPPKNIYLR